MNYEEDLAIDPSILDVECVDHSMLVIKYVKLAADAEREMDEAKEKLDLVKADLDNAIRTNPEDFDIGKITEAVVTNTILQQDEYKKAMKAFLDAKYQAKIVNGASKAVDHRKSMLEVLAKLHGQQYFAGPNIPHDLTKEWKQKHDQQKADSTIKMKRREK